MSTICCTLNYVSTPTNSFYLNATTSAPNDVATPLQRLTHHQQNKRARRAGSIILNYNTGQLLIIQSYHQYWGLPKGHVEENESHLECTIRETLEETGIVLHEHDFLKKFNIFNGDGTYYLVDGTDLNFDESKICNKEEITGISWMCPTCIRRNVRFQEMIINSHLRLLLPSIVKELNEGTFRHAATTFSERSPKVKVLKKIDSFSTLKKEDNQKQSTTEVKCHQ